MVNPINLYANFELILLTTKIEERIIVFKALIEIETFANIFINTSKLRET